MLVRTIMMKDRMITTISSTTKLNQALDIMEANNLLSIPVVDGHKFIGAIEKSAIYEKYFKDGISKEELLNDIEVKELIRHDIPIIGQDEEIENAVELLEKMNVSFVCVINKESGHFKGILTHKIVFRQFTNLFGLNQGERISVVTYDVPGQLSKLSNIVTENGGNIISLVVVNPESLIDNKEIIIRLHCDRIDEIKDAIKDAGFKMS